MAVLPPGHGRGPDPDLIGEVGEGEAVVLTELGERVLIHDAIFP
jgi:hypothetical protein